MHKEPVLYQPSNPARFGLLFFFIVVGLISVFVWNEAPDYRILLVAIVGFLFFYGSIADFFIQSGIRRGLRAYSNDDYETAIRELERAYEFFERNSWIDRYRRIIALDISAIGYREVTLYNIGTIQLQAGNLDGAKAAYRRMLESFPKNRLAQRGMEMIVNLEQPSAD